MKWWCVEAEGEPNLGGNYFCKKRREEITTVFCYACPDRWPLTKEDLIKKGNDA